jgi:hypothetical protein
MKMRTMKTTFALFALAAASPSFAATLITNGSFELGNTSGGFSTVAAGGTDITGWTVDTGSVDYISSYWQPLMVSAASTLPAARLVRFRSPLPQLQAKLIP